MFEKEKEQGIIKDSVYELIQQYVERLEQNNMPIIFNLRHLRKILKIKKSEQDEFFGIYRRNLYNSFKIPKRSGGFRKIEAPVDKLKNCQQWIKEKILDNIETSKHAKGFKKGQSIYENALPHVNKELVINIDIKDFFPSVSYSQVFRVFKYVGYTNQVAHLLTKICTNSNNVLPQGSPASPGLSNIVLLKLDKRLGNLAEKMNCTYTRYADDITLSGDKSIKTLLPLVFKIVQEEGFEINQNKVRLQYQYQRQEVTGLIVNKKVSVSKKTVKELENAIYYCQKYGVVNHMHHIGCDKAFYKEHLYGIAYFIKMIDGDRGNHYLSELDKINWPY